ncbi:hypothetical protein A5714_06510 [Mycobacterium sp. E2462]|uniref:hypothetical protein n=1 Tax=Mycobacterium sp. E2462 TaxID=1834133 RepID=UPI000800EC40|nr:hypothetical protein [Mycobacterium sp. E2462]OBI22182.1 hypothetical protein A5714_06510 [Mycobacterium sp. E2462]
MITLENHAMWQDLVEGHSADRPDGRRLFNGHRMAFPAVGRAGRPELEVSIEGVRRRGGAVSLGITFNGVDCRRAHAR